SHDQLYRTCRSRRGELNNSEVGGGPVVDVEGEAGLLSVKRERTVDIGDRQRDDLQGEHHASPEELARARSPHLGPQKVPDGHSDFAAVRLKSEVSRVKERDLRV